MARTSTATHKFQMLCKCRENEVRSFISCKWPKMIRASRLRRSLRDWNLASLDKESTFNNKTLLQIDKVWTASRMTPSQIWIPHMSAPFRPRDQLLASQTQKTTPWALPRRTARMPPNRDLTLGRPNGRLQTIWSSIKSSHQLPSLRTRTSAKTYRRWTCQGPITRKMSNSRARAGRWSPQNRWQLLWTTMKYSTAWGKGQPPTMTSRRPSYP